uniref:Tex protein YqgF-like domain-containing protein n=1 Tax=Timema monikensis TaxID=170555 RepID=A0A7R9HJL5_9NEOP|nr:unnamed protein product [Timema monikensis]
MELLPSPLISGHDVTGTKRNLDPCSSRQFNGTLNAGSTGGVRRVNFYMGGLSYGVLGNDDDDDDDDDRSGYSMTAPFSLRNWKLVRGGQCSRCQGLSPTRQRELNPGHLAQQTNTLLAEQRCDLIALGNGTASRNVEKYISDLITSGWFSPLNVQYTIISEAGSSVYSCSPLAKKEFPSLDPKLISAVSLARRVQDPLSEYIKVDPKHLGVGMYQHDLKEKHLNEKLQTVIQECVSNVGVDINTASLELLKSPLRKCMVKGASCLSPAVMTSGTLRVQRVNIALEQLTSNNHIAYIEAEHIRKNYLEICEQSSVQEELKTFDYNETRLDSFLFNIFINAKACKALLSFCTMIFTMFHGNSAVERGFSVNKECLVENMKERSLISQRSIYSAVQSVGGIKNVEFTSGMLHAARRASSKRREAIEEMKKKESEEANRSKTTLETVNKLEAKKRKLLQQAEEEASALQTEIDLEKKRLRQMNVAGLNASRASNLIEWRSTNGAFKNRQQILKVKGIGKKSFEQCAGFVRIQLSQDSINYNKTKGDKEKENPLDRTWIHPETYSFAKSVSLVFDYVPIREFPRLIYFFPRRYMALDTQKQERLIYFSSLMEHVFIEFVSAHTPFHSTIFIEMCGLDLKKIGTKEFIQRIEEYVQNHDTLYVLDLRTNLISVAKIVDTNNKVISEKDRDTIKYIHDCWADTKVNMA